MKKARVWKPRGAPYWLAEAQILPGEPRARVTYFFLTWAAAFAWAIDPYFVLDWD